MIMLTFNHYSFVYFIGIGGIGMSALARLLAHQGYQIFGYDQHPSDLVLELIKEGMHIVSEDSATVIPKIIEKYPKQTLVIYTPAIPNDNLILTYFRERGYAIYTRAEIVGMIATSFSTIAIAGTHGKTTTSAMIAHILYQSHQPMVALVGGIILPYNTNFLYNSPLDQAKYMVIEADEFNRSFLHLNPTFSIVTAADADHPETYQTPALMIDSFITFIKQNKKKLLIQYKAADQLNSANQYTKPFQTYGLTKGDIVANNIQVKGHETLFDYIGAEVKISDILLPMTGWYNVENALAAITISLELGINVKEIHKAMAGFGGIQRRCSLICKYDKWVLIDDYAHHPVEISALLTSLRGIYPKSCLIAIFQPHLFSRTQAFYKSFAASLSAADEVFILPIYPARELPIPWVTSQLIYDALTCKRKALITMDTLPESLASSCLAINQHQVVVTIGAGDIGASVSTVSQTLKKFLGDS